MSEGCQSWPRCALAVRKYEPDSRHSVALGDDPEVENHHGMLNCPSFRCFGSKSVLANVWSIL